MYTTNRYLKHPLPLLTLNTTQLQISKIFLSFLILNINVNGPDFFKLRELSFVLFIFSSLPFGNYNKLWPFLLAVSIYLITAVLNIIIPGSNVTSLEALKYVLGFFYLYLLIFDKEVYRNTIKKTFLVSTTITALMIVIIWLVCMVNSDIRIAMSTYFSENNSGKTAFVFMIRSRKFLNWWFLGVYFGTAPAMIPSLGYILYRNLNRRKARNIFIILLHLAALIMTGARANILAALILMFSFVCLRLYLKKKIFLATILITNVGFLFIVVFILLLTDRNESSLAVKTLHQNSYFREFSEHPIRYLLIGTGGGSTFFSEGYKNYTNITELTLYETIRRYGLIGTTFLFIVLWINPIIKVLVNTISIADIYYCIVMSIYIMVALTNPYLFGSIGFLTILFFRNVSNPFLKENRLNLRKGFVNI